MNPKTTKIYFLGIDTEDKGNHDPYLFALYGQLCTRQNVVHDINMVTDNIEDILKILKIECKDTYLVAFNMNYDLNNLFPQYDRERNFWKGKFSGFKNNRHQIKGIEMAGSWYQGINLKELSEKFEVEYIDEHNENDPHIKEACLSHAKAIQQITSKTEALCNELGFSMRYAKYWMPTAAGLAFHAWSIIEKQDKNNWDTSQNEIAGLSYHGGWCDLFKKGYQKGYHYDIVSAYPFSMHEYEYPNPNIPFVKTTPSQLTWCIQNKAGFAVGTIHIPDILISPFPKQHEGKLIFGTGSWKTVITFPELEYLYELGGTFHCDEVYYTERWKPFVNYVDKFYEYKKQKKYKEVAKLFLNGLSGKFGQRNHPEGIYTLVTQEEIDSLPSNVFGVKEYFPLDKKMFEYLKPVDSSEETEYTYYPLISAYITAYTRIKLHKVMKEIGYENVIYCDTDSIVSNVKIPDKYITTTKELGKWDCEAENIIFYGIAPKKYKEYRNNKWVYRANGIPKKEQENFWKNPYAPITLRQPISFKQALRRHTTVNKWIPVIKVHCEENKRMFKEDGTSEPFKIQTE